MNDLLDDIPYEKLSSDAEQVIEVAPPPQPGFDLETFTTSASEVSALVSNARSFLESISKLQKESKVTASVETFLSLSTDMSEKIVLVTRLAKDIKSRIDALVADNVLNLTYPDCGPGSSIERARTNITNELRERLQDIIISFSSLKEDLDDDRHSEFRPEVATYLREAEEQRLQAVADNPNEFLDLADHMKQRNESVKQLNTNLKGLMQMFTDMVVVVDAQGKQLDSIDEHVDATVVQVDSGLEELVEAKKFHDRAVLLKLIFFAIVAIIVVVLLICFAPYIINLFEAIT